MVLMKETANVYDGLIVDRASLIKTDHFYLNFSDGTGVELTLRQIQAIRLIRLTDTTLRIVDHSSPLREATEAKQGNTRPLNGG